MTHPNDHIMRMRNVERIEQPVARRADPDQVSRELDEQRRAQLLQGLTGCDTANIQQVAQLLGDHDSQYGRGPRVRRLLAAARAGELELAGDLNHYKGPNGERGQARGNPATTPMKQEHLHAWLTQYGTDAERCSAAAEWCGFYNPTTQETA